MLERVGDVVYRGQLASACATAWMVGSGAASRERGDGMPADGSPMAQDLAVHRSGTAGPAQVQRVASRWLEAGANMLQGLGALIDQGITTDALGPLHRSIVEYSSRAAWIVGGADADSRVARSLLAHLVSTAEDVRTHAEAGKNSLAMAGAPERLRKLVDDTIPQLAGVQPDLGTPGGRTRPIHYRLCGESYGSIRDVVDWFVQDNFGRNGTLIYRTQSLFTHPTTSGAFVFVDEAEDGSATVQTPLSYVAGSTLATLLCWRAANRRVCDYLGWEPEQFGAWSALVDAIDLTVQRSRYHGPGGPGSQEPSTSTEG